MALTEKGKKGIITLAIIAIVIAVGAYGIIKIGPNMGSLTKKVDEVQQLEESDVAVDNVINAAVLENANSNLPFRELPSKKRLVLKKKDNGVELNASGIMWNGSSAFMAANGGANTKQGSYFDWLGQEYGKPFTLNLRQQDDYSVQQNELVTFTKEYLTNGNTDKGSAMVWFMGDNAMAYTIQLNNQLKQLEKDFPGTSISGVGFVLSGYSYGEDKFMGPVDWEMDPDLARGAVVACYPQDGDQNLVIKWAADNGIPINPDGSTYCADAINFSFTNDFMEASRAFGTMTGKRIQVTIDEETGETRKLIGRDTSVQILGVGTWFPGDEEAFTKAKREGYDLISLYDTKDNAHQMPCLIMTVNVFYDQNRELIDAITEGIVRQGDQMKTHPEAFNYAMECMADVYGTRTAAEWAEAFIGFTVETPEGYEVELGGSRTCNLADNIDALGVGKESRATFESSYDLFGGYMHKLYPEYMPDLLPYYSAIDVRSVERVAKKMKAEGTITPAKQPDFADNESSVITNTVANRSYSIEFKTGSATLTASGIAAIKEMYTDLNTHDLLITIYGHTDNTGTDKVNIPLSEARANAVYTWLRDKNPASFPASRFAEVKGFGSQKPVADNSTWQGKAKNRRVEITVGYGK